MDLDLRMKAYEQDSVGKFLVRRCPAILRIDGKAFHSYCKGFNRPWDWRLHHCMHQTGEALCQEIQGAKMAYGQSDEISVLLTDYETFTTEQWFGGKVQKIVSVAASIATLTFNSTMRAIEERAYAPLSGQLILDTPHWEQYKELGLVSDRDAPTWRHTFIDSMPELDTALFDARIFSIPREDVTNYFVWRQQDAVRNSIQMLAQSYFSHKELLNLNNNQLQEKLWQEKKVNWNDTPVTQKRGWAVCRSNSEWTLDLEMPTISQDRDFVEKLVYPTNEEEKE